MNVHIGDAKAVYMQQYTESHSHTHPRSHTLPLTHPHTHIPVIPRNWTMKTFFMGHPPLSEVSRIDLVEAISVINMTLPPLTPSLLTDLSDASEEVESTKALSIHDIDVTNTTNSNGGLILLPDPPAYLLDRLLVLPASTEEVKADAEHMVTQEASSIICHHILTGYSNSSNNSNDSRAYHILKRLVALVDSMWLNSYSISSPPSTTDTSNGSATPLALFTHNSDLHDRDGGDDKGRSGKVGVVGASVVDNLSILVDICEPLLHGTSWLSDLNSDVNENGHNYDHMKSESLAGTDTGYIIDYGRLEPVSVMRSDWSEEVEGLMECSNDLLKQHKDNNNTKATNITGSDNSSTHTSITNANNNNTTNNATNITNIINKGLGPGSDTNNTTPEASAASPPSALMLELLSILSLPEVVQWTGVCISPQGSVTTVKVVPLLRPKFKSGSGTGLKRKKKGKRGDKNGSSSSAGCDADADEKEEEDVWEDIDSDDEEDSSSNNDDNNDSDSNNDDASDDDFDTVVERKFYNLSRFNNIGVKKEHLDKNNYLKRVLTDS